MAVAQTAAILHGVVSLTPIVWAGFARRRTTVSRFHRKRHGGMTRESGVFWDIRLTVPVTTNSAITVATTRSGCSKLKRRLQRVGNCREATICVANRYQSLRHVEAESRIDLELNSRNGHSRSSCGRTYSGTMLPIFASGIRPLQNIDFRRL
jgi:hypothetical protein